MLINLRRDEGVMMPTNSQEKEGETKTLKIGIPPLYGVEIGPKGDKYEWRKYDKYLSNQEPIWWRNEKNTFEDALRDLIDFLAYGHSKYQLIMWALEIYHSTKEAYKTWKSEVLPQLRQCIEFTEDRTKFVVKCPEWKLKELDRQTNKLLGDIISTVYEPEVLKWGNAPYFVDEAIRRIREIQSNFHSGTFEEPLRNALGRAITLINQMVYNPYTWALGEILYPPEDFDEPIEEEEEEEEEEPEEEEWEEGYWSEEGSGDYISELEGSEEEEGQEEEQVEQEGQG
jgi:hypothetical protein